MVPPEGDARTGSSWSERWWPALLGLAGMVAVVVGVARPDSPFTTKLPDAWYFGLAGTAHPGSAPPAGEWVGLLSTYAGILMVLAAWYWLVGPASAQAASARPDRRLWAILAAWTAPLLVGPPLLSRDVYAYAAEGRLAAAGRSPYTHVPAALGHSPLLTLVDPLWRHSHAPYGPFFMDLAGVASRAAGSSVPGTVLGLRLVAVAGVALTALAIGPLARSAGQDPTRAFALAALNPLVLLYLIGGAHNDALMLGLLVAGVAVARRGHPITGVLLCALAASVKAPAAIGIVYVGWGCAGPGAPALRRWGRLAGAVVLGGVAMAAVSVASGFGWGWLENLSAPGKVVSWLDPATAAGLGTGHLLDLLGAGGHQAGAVTVARDLALVAAAALSVVLLARSDRIGQPAAIGWSLLAFALLGPVVWPWYETWGLVFLAAAAGLLARRVVLVLSAIGCFATAPGSLAVTTGGAVALAAGLALVAVVLALVLAGHRRRIGRWPPTSWSTGPCMAAGAGGTSAER